MKKNLISLFCLFSIPLVFVPVLSSCSEQTNVKINLIFWSNNSNVTISNTTITSLNTEFNTTITKSNDLMFDTLTITIDGIPMIEGIDYYFTIDKNQLFLKILSRAVTSPKILISVITYISKPIPDDYFILSPRNQLLGLKEGVVLSNFNTLKIPDVTTEINDEAFKNIIKIKPDLNIKYLVFNDELKKIGDSAFEGCTGFTGYLSFPNYLYRIGNNAFKDCVNFKGSINFNSYLSELGNGAFEGCTGFNGNLNLSNNIAFIGNNTFKNCSNLVGSLWFPSPLRSIGDFAFAGCENINGTLNLNNDLLSIGDFAFENCKRMIGDLLLPSLTYLGNYAFAGCENLSGSLIIPGSLQSIKSYTFYNCKGFNGLLEIDNEITSIGDYAFAGCINMMGRIKLPLKLQYLGKYAFKNCFTFSGELQLPLDIRKIDEGAFYSCSGISGKIDFNSSANLTEINNQAFKGCLNLNEVILSNSIKRIGESVFENCSNLSSLKIETTINTENYIGYRSFYKCTKLTKIDFDGVQLNEIPLWIQQKNTEFFLDIASKGSIIFPVGANENLWIKNLEDNAKLPVGYTK